QARYPAARCLQGTRVHILQEILEWITGGDEHILWLTGPAGSGKSTIAQTIAEICADNSTLGASFFFCNGAHGRDTVESLIPSLVHQLTTRIKCKRENVGKVIEDDPTTLHRPFKAQLEKLVYSIFASETLNNMHTEIQPSTPINHFLIIIDGLDECKGDKHQCDVIEQLGRLSVDIRVPFRFVIISRPEPQIWDSF
ncbi:hypothetical protein BDZ94DRAFT_1120476, partial [Collybia nuda]